MVKKIKVIVGKAYGFFSCAAPRDEVIETLPAIRAMVETPSELELRLSGDKVTPEKFAHGNWVQISGPVYATSSDTTYINYCLHASLVHRKGSVVADELSAILNQAYQSPLYNEGDKFAGRIYYIRKGKVEERIF